MNYLIECIKCGALCWVPGTYEADTNACVLSDDDPYDWDGGRETCEHTDFEIIDEEPTDD